MLRPGRHRGCGPVELHLSRRASARRKLRAIARGAGLALHELAAVIGVEPKTISNHLGGRRMSVRRVDWYHRVEAIVVSGDLVTITLRYHPTRKRWGWLAGHPPRRIPSISIAVLTL